jgi:type IV pilus assembly protein PilA
MKKVQGFTLIELMIVVAIIGILAAIALPAYSDYTKRTHVSEGLSLASSAKSSITEYYADRGHYPDDNGAAGLAKDTSILGNAVDSVKVVSNVITITYNAKVATNQKLALAASATAGSVKWFCGYAIPSGLLASGHTTVLQKWLPATCRS